MSYEVTANRKRPTNFDGLVGQEFVVATLKNSLKTGRIAHAYLFAGPRGIGKTSAARILARSLNCPDGPDPEGCADCPEADAISRGQSVDVIEIDGASNTSVNDVRQIKDEVLFAPQASRYKIYIIDEVHMLSNSAFNALLKTIEEPPPYIIFVFATTEVHKVPATIRSRCQQFNFRLIPTERIAECLREAAEEMELEAEDDALYWMAKEGRGSLRDAYTLFDQVVSFSEARITQEQIRSKLGLVGLERLNELVETVVSGDARRALELADETIAAGVSVEQIAMDLAEYFRTALFLRHGITKRSLIGYGAEQVSSSVVDNLTPAQLEKAIDMLFELYRNIRYSLDARFELEVVLSRMCELRSYLTPRQLLAEIERAKRGQSASVAGAGTRAASAASSPDRTWRAGAEGEAPATGAEPAATGSNADSGEQRAPQPGAGDGGNGDGTTAAADQETGDGAPRTQTGSGPAESGDADDADVADAPVQAVEEISGLAGEERAAIVKGGRRKKLSLGTNLEKATAWAKGEGVLHLVFPTAYPAQAVTRERELVSDVVQEVLGYPLRLEIRLDQEQAEPEEDDVPEDVALVRRVFRGEIVSGS